MSNIIVALTTGEHDGEMSYPESLASRAPTDESTGGAEDTEGANVDEDGPPAKAIAAPARVAITAMPDVSGSLYTIFPCMTCCHHRAAIWLCRAHTPDVTLPHLPLFVFEPACVSPLVLKAKVLHHRRHVSRGTVLGRPRVPLKKVGNASHLSCYRSR